MARALLARFDADAVVVYQAYPEELGREIVEMGRFGGSWRFDRHTRIQPSWRGTLRRYAFGERPDRERILAVRVRRAGFDALLTAALQQDFDERLYASRQAWRLATRFAPVLVEWEPDPDGGEEVARLRLHGPLVRRFAEEWVVGIEDVSARARAAGTDHPVEEPYPVPADVAVRIGLS